MDTTELLIVLLLGALALGGCGAPPAALEDHDHGQAVAEHEEEAGHGEESAEETGGHGALRLTPQRLAEYGLELAVAGPGELQLTTELPGVVHLDGDRLAHVTPRVGGVVQRVEKLLGDAVAAGELMAVLQSRELADAKAAFLAARERLALAEATHQREERLWQQQVSAEQDYLDASNRLAEAQIELRLASQQLQALGLDAGELQHIAEQPDTLLTHYRIVAPFAGEVVHKHLTLGETVAAETPVFTVADLSRVWIDLQVYQKDLGSVRAGQQVRVVTNHGSEADLTIGFVQPLVGEETRTALARIVADNHDGMWHPGCFVTAHVQTGTIEVPMRLPRSALIRLEDGDTVVFVEDEDGLEPRPVEVGRRDHSHVEVADGIALGTRYVARGAFTLKAELGKDALGGHAGHGH